MYLELACVEAFHDKLGVSEPETWRPMPKRIGQTLLKLSKELEAHVKTGDVHALRAHLLLEELGEFLCAETEELALDGLTDLLYVLLGTAVTYDWPLSAAFAEVHRSNMTKVRQEDDPLGNRVREKGQKYEPPKIAEILKLHSQGLDGQAKASARREVKELHAAFQILRPMPEAP